MKTFHSRPSTWLAVASVVITAFSALPTLTSLGLHAANVGILALLILVSHREGKRS